ncbi:universal stress protein family domain-containing protein [Coprinopsis sp. MPI-PUGE-AT-0042]|nr:universal stress protein family domain-containing protein [Coprinopsis sp. MPI-PUGE-AT-0042]
MASHEPQHGLVAPLRSAMKSSRATSPSRSSISSPTTVPTPLSDGPGSAFSSKMNSPTLLSQVPLPPSPTPSSPRTARLPPSQQIQVEKASQSLSGSASPAPSTFSSTAASFAYNTPIASSLAPPHSSAASSNVSKGPYTPKVSFDTFENPQASMFSFTLQVKSAGYKRTRTTRVYLCAAGPDESGQEALDWALESLAQDGDEVIVFRGVDEDNMGNDHNILREDARALFKRIQEKSAEVDPDRKLSLILEYIPGKIADSIDRLIALYRPDSLVVGTRGRKGLLVTFAGIGSISKYVLLQHFFPLIFRFFAFSILRLDLDDQGLNSKSPLPRPSFMALLTL